MSSKRHPSNHCARPGDRRPLGGRPVGRARLGVRTRAPRPGSRERRSAARFGRSPTEGSSPRLRPGGWSATSCSGSRAAPTHSQRLLDLGRRLEHERDELAAGAWHRDGSVGPLSPMHATRRPARSRIGAETDTRPSSSSSTISAQPRRLTLRSSEASPERVVTVRAVSRAGWASSNQVSSSLWLSSARTSFPADDACSGTSAPTQPTTPRRCAASSWLTISIPVRPVTMARRTDSSARSRSLRSGLSAASIRALWGSALRASRNSSLPITHPAGVSATSPRSANVRSVRLTVARGCPVERASADAEAGSADRATAGGRRSPGRAQRFGGCLCCSSDEQSRQPDDQLPSSTGC